MLKLRPWPFCATEEVKLHWLCSPYQDKDRRWMMRVVFESLETHDFKPVLFPWGTLPYLRYGRIYSDGCITEKYVGSQFEVTIPSQIHSEFVDGFAIPNFMWPLLKNSLYGCQRLWSFWVGKNRYLIPCLEAIRAFLTPYKTLVNRILTPDGLDFLVDKELVINKKLHLELNSNFPGTLLHDAVITHLAWLRHNPSAKEAWKSVYTRLLIESIQRDSLNPAAFIGRGIPLECRAPIDADITLKCRGVSTGNINLILEILHIKGNKHPFSSIDYYHPLLRSSSSENTERSGKNRKGKKDSNNNEQNKTGETARNDSNPEIIENISAAFDFPKKPTVRRRRYGKRKTDSGGDGKTYAVTTTVTTQDSDCGGKIRPIEFQGIEIVHAIKGLESFLAAIEILGAKNKDWDISYSVINLPEGAVFSKTPDGDRRMCAVVTIRRLTGDCFYLIEVARPDDWSVATLLFWPNMVSVNNTFIKETIVGLIDSLIKNKGHWDLEKLIAFDSFSFQRMPHTNSGTRRWAERISQIVKLT